MTALVRGPEIVRGFALHTAAAAVATGEEPVGATGYGWAVNLRTTEPTPRHLPPFRRTIENRGDQ